MLAAKRMDKEGSSMSITRNLNGSITVSAMIEGYLTSRSYYGDTVQEAKRLFRPQFNLKWRA